MNFQSAEGDIRSPDPLGSWVNSHVDLVKEYHALGCNCIILTARFKNQFNEMEIKEFIQRCNLPITEVVYTGHLAKGIFAHEHDVKMHYDDDPFHLESIKAYDIIAVDSINHKIFKD